MDKVVLPVWIIMSSLFMYWILETVFELNDMNTDYERRYFTLFGSSYVHLLLLDF